jgi:ABC-2 type transport system ATP-binding protein
MSDSTAAPALASPPNPPATAPSADLLIQAEGLSKYYGDFTAIRNVSFSVPRGSVTAFLGPNGAGKSTTMKILTGYLAPSEGRALIAGHDVEHQRLEASRVLGYLPENGPLYPDMTPGAYLRFIGEARGMSAAALREALDRVAASCRIEEVWHKTINKLSKGFRQRVCLAQAIIHDPQVLILDEPTAGLDPNQIVLVRDLVKQLAKTKTVLLSTHILQEVEAMADRVVLISEGRVVFQGAPKELAAGRSIEDRFRELTKGVAE